MLRELTHPCRVILRPHRRHSTFSTASPARNSNDLLITRKLWNPSQHRSVPSSGRVRATVSILLSLLEGSAAIMGFYEPAPAEGVRIHAPSEVFPMWDRFVVKFTPLDVLQIPMTTLRAGYLVIHGYCSRPSPSFLDSLACQHDCTPLSRALP